MNSKEKKYLVLDTETIGVHKKLCYDISFTICTKSKILFSESFIVEEIYTNTKFMKDAFYGKKVFTQYPYLLEQGKILIKPFKWIINHINSVIKEYNISSVCAYNLVFDSAALKNTMYWVLYGTYNNLKSKLCKVLINRNYEYIDLWLASCEIIGKRVGYKKFCKEYNFMTPNDNYKTSAESMYSYITNNPEFIEAHTGLEDSIIEAKILQYIISRKKKFTRNKLISNPWRIVNPDYKRKKKSINSTEKKAA